MKKRIFIIVFVSLSITILGALFYPEPHNPYENLETHYPSLLEVKELYEPYVGSISATEDLGYFYLTDFPWIVFYHSIPIYDYYGTAEKDNEEIKRHEDVMRVQGANHNVNSVIVESYLYELINSVLSEKASNYLFNMTIREGDYRSENIIETDQQSILTYLNSYHGLLTLHILLESSDEKQIAALYDSLDQCLGEIQSISESLVIDVKIGLSERINQYKVYKLANVFEIEDIKQESFLYGKTKK